MNRPFQPSAGRPRIPAALWAFVALLLACPAGRADAGSGDELRLAIVLTRHGVRAPISSNDSMASLASQPWPKWEVDTAIQTPHGNLLMAYMGDYYRARFVAAGLLSGDPAKDGPLVFVRADNDQRTMETGRILGKALVQAGEPDVHSLPEGTKDPLFRAVAAHVGHPDPSVAAAAVLGTMGGDPRNMERAFAPQFAELEGILYGPGGPPAGSPFNAPSVVSPGRGDNFVEVNGPFHEAERCVDAFLLEYTDGKPSGEVGWGKVDGKALTDLLTLHELYFDLVCRTHYVAQVEGSNMASHIIDTLEQAALGQPVPGALGPAGERVVVLVGHDSTIANIGGLLDLDWWVPGTQKNPMLPGGAMVFELRRRAGPQDSFYVRISYVTQTLEQMREANPLTRDNPPALAPIFIPGCSGPGPGYDAPLAAFVRQARKVIDPSFIAPEP
jgi:4-phytase/acid phosphatase